MDKELKWVINTGYMSTAGNPDLAAYLSQSREGLGVLVPQEVILEGGDLRFLPATGLPISSGPLARLSLQGWGWKRVEDTSQLLKEILSLSEQGGAGARSLEAVRRFALQWGPLWTCSVHLALGGCWWGPDKQPWSMARPLSMEEEDIIQGFREAIRRGRCRWSGVESVADYFQLAGEVTAALGIAKVLQGKEKYPGIANVLQGKEEYPAGWGSWWETLRGWEVTLPDGKQAALEKLVRFVNRRLAPHSMGLGFRLSWEGVKAAPQFALETGLGFVPAAWLAVSMKIASGRGLYTCSSCGRPFISEGRKRKDGLQAFCPEHSEGGRGSKKLWAQRHAGKSAK